MRCGGSGPPGHDLPTISCTTKENPFHWVIGAAAALAGAVWTLQGLGYVGGSFMSGATVWAVIGPLVALAGLALIVLGLRSRRRAH